ncbi:MAG TPA: AAA family ATPase, partial [Roseiarcus sp.]|nr:AAA family ATPase [Roseiarcus sp.]
MSPEEKLAQIGMRVLPPAPAIAPPPNGAHYGKVNREKGNGGSHPQPAKTRFIPAYRRGIKVLDGEELLTTQFPPRNTIMSPWLPDKGLAMLYAERGIGKTWIALGAAHAVASGGEFLCWRAERPRKVLYIDGEMPAHTLQERYAAVVRASMKDAPRENFRLAAADCQPDG